MKFIGIILLLLTSIFLIACSANQASNKINNSELENLASKYGGVYVFNQKFVEEIEKREAERKELSKSLGDKIRSNPRKIKQGDKFITIYDVDMTLVNEKPPRILSNGKQYHTINTYQKAVNLSKTYIDKVINHIGQENYYKSTPDINVWSFYIDDNNNIVPIELTVTYNYKVKKYGLFGDEGRGFSLSKGEIRTAKGGNKFILNNNKFEKVK
ncbi:tRNA 2-selenouridine synthase [Campylobacter concisus]|uniref:tRNA 2-selenouridine synthase n=1 Tax=Campylobacter concisus TaxID=199 RepID=UPI000D3149E3|nr:tRNA 2-selenouridine synthase [Campylobacter concisus]